MSVFAGEMDAATLICPDWQTFSCMAKTPLILSYCTPLLDAALIYVGIDLPRSDQQLRQLCGITSSSITVTSTLSPLPVEEVAPEPEPAEPAAPAEPAERAPNPPVEEATETAETAATAGAETASGENSLSVQSVAEAAVSLAPNVTNTSTVTTTVFVTDTATETATTTGTATETHSVTESTTASSTVTATTTTRAPFGTVDTVLDGASGLSAPWLLLASCIWIWW